MSKKFSRVPNLSVWEPITFELLEGVVKRIESTFGRLQVMVFVEGGNDGSFLDAKDKVLRRIEEESVHFREDFRDHPEHNFGSIPDPFAAYIARLDPSEVVKDPDAQDTGLLHIEDKGHKSLMEREIQK